MCGWWCLTFAHAYVYWDSIGDNRVDTARG